MYAANRVAVPASRVFALVVMTACAVDPGATDIPDPHLPCVGKCDGPTKVTTTPVATQRRLLLAGLFAQMDAPSLLFGQERFNVTGVNDDGTQWLATEQSVDRSDARTVAGDHPAVMGFDAWDLAIKPETWAPTPRTHAEAAKYVHAHGGVVAMEWHMRGCAADTFNAAGNEACLCKLANDDAYARAWLLDGNYKMLADALVRYGLDQIPIVFRPLHEHNGNWFWWGKPFWSCGSYVPNPRFTGAAAYQRVYRTIITYLRVERGLHNLLVAYSPGGSDALATEAGYLDGYPGDEYVDILGADLYYQRDPSFDAQTAAFRSQLENITSIAYARGKVAALTEVGDTQIAGDTTPEHSRWFTEQLLPLVESPSVHVAYALTWENRTSGPQQFWIPYGAHPGVADFRAFEASDTTRFLSDAPAFDRVPADGYPVCASCGSDPDGDRWGWEDDRSCRVASWCLTPAYPICAKCISDPDGDGWGWEDQRSCEVLATCQ
jgi:mannan endo-1,4-beta-mannosidase